MKKNFKMFLIAAILLPAIFLFSACGKSKETDTRVELSSNNIILEFENYEYTETAIEPTVSVVVNKTVISEEDYTVEYSDNVEIGTAKVTVTAKNSSSAIKGSATKTFEIIKPVIEVADYDELINAIRIGDKNIRLTNNIEAQTIENRNEVYIFSGTENENAIPANLNFELDLNGFVIENPIYIDNYSDGGDFTSNITIKNGTIVVNNEESSVRSGYGIVVVGNENLSLTLKNLTVQAPSYAITTDESGFGATINAEECKFIATGTNTPIAAYLIANHAYTFKSCTFEGDCAYCLSAGEHSLENCEFYADGKYGEIEEPSEEDFNFASAIVIFTADINAGAAKEISVSISGGVIVSKEGFALEEFKNETGEEIPSIISVTLLSVDITCADGTSEDTAFKVEDTVNITQQNCTFKSYVPESTNPPVADGENEL